MFLTSLLLSVAPAPVHVQQDTRREQVTAEYHELATAEDAEGLAALWKDNVGLVLQTIDADLEGSLALWENAKESPPTEEIAALQARALFAARVASRALGEPIFMDYASSFVGWNNDQKAAFRAGQAVFGRAMQELKDKNHEVALMAGRETVERASALGDWWGAAMGYGAEAAAAREMGLFEDSLRAYGMARQINHALGLEYSEYRNLQGMLAVARADDRFRRAHAIAEDLIEFAEAFKEAPVLKQTLTAKVEIEKALGLNEAAAATKAKLEALGD